MQAAAHAFLLGFPALFSIVNPLAGAFIFREMTANVPVEQRVRLAGKVATYSLLMMMAALLLLCIGVQILITGVVDVLEPLMKLH